MHPKEELPNAESMENDGVIDAEKGKLGEDKNGEIFNELSTQNGSKVSPEEKSPTEVSTNEEYIEVFKRWKELKGQDLIQLFKDGWKPA